MQLLDTIPSMAPQISTVTTVDKNFFYKQIGVFNGKIAATFDSLPAKGKCGEIAKRVTLVLVAIFVYIGLFILSLIERCTPLAKTTTSGFTPVPNKGAKKAALPLSQLIEACKPNLKKELNQNVRETFTDRKIVLYMNCNGEILTPFLFDEGDDIFEKLPELVEKTRSNFWNHEISSLKLEFLTETDYIKDGEEVADFYSFHATKQASDEDLSITSRSRSILGIRRNGRLYKEMMFSGERFQGKKSTSPLSSS